MFLCIMVVKVLVVCLSGGWFGVFLIVGCDFFQVEDEFKKNLINRLNCSVTIMLALPSLIQTWMEWKMCLGEEQYWRNLH